MEHSIYRTLKQNHIHGENKHYQGKSLETPLPKKVSN